jgi:hypothetical protein
MERIAKQSGQYFIFQALYGNLLLYSLKKRENGNVYLDSVSSNKPFFDERDDVYDIVATEEEWQELLKIGAYKEIIFDKL